MTASYQPSLVIVSILIAMLASYTALGLGARVINADRESLKYWMLGGSFAMGLGIWAMHFIGMLAFHLPIPLAYDPGITLLSIVPAIGASSIALYTLHSGHRETWRFYSAATLMGIGIAGMHYTGMAAMRMMPGLQYDPLLFTLSILIAILASIVALQLVLRFEGSTEHQLRYRKPLAAAVMGVAIAGMHYTGMAATIFAPGSICLAANDGLSGPVLASLVGAGSILVLLIAMAAMVLDRLRGQNAFYSTLLKAQSDIGEGVLLLEGEQIVYANEGMRKLTGQEPEALLNVPNVFRLIHADDQAKVRKLIGSMSCASGATRRCEMRLLAADDRIHHCELAIACFPFRDRIRTLFALLDITERMESEQRLRTSEQKLRTMYEHTPLGICLADIQGFFIEANPGLTDMLGYSMDEVAKLSFEDIIYKQDRRALEQIFNNLQQHNAFGPIDLRLRQRAGNSIHVSVTGVLVDDAEGNPRIWATVEDITERVEATKQLRLLNETLEERVSNRTVELEDAREFLEAILQTAGALIMLLDSDGRIVRFNNACEDLSGCRFEEVRNRSFWESLHPPEQRAQMQHNFLRILHQDDLEHFEGEWLTRGGERRIITWSNSVLRGKTGRVQYVIATGIDITERKKAEKALVAANRELQGSLETLTETQTQLVQSEKMASLGGLVAGISHEINTPLGIGVTSATNIQEEVDKLRKRFDSGSMKRSDMEGFLNHVRQASGILLHNLRRASELITSFKQVAVDQSSDAWRTLDLHEYVDEIVLSLKPKLKNTRVQIHNHCEPGLTLYTHPGAIYQVLSNFIINSLVHGFADEETGNIEINAARAGNEVVLSYQDDGAGIPPENRAMIFDPFYTTRRGSGGSGLGLHIVYNLINATLKGSIELDTSREQGVRFEVKFPYKEEGEA